MSEQPFSGIAFNLSSLGYAVSRGFQAILAPFELHPREFAVLRAVGFQEGQTQQALADRLQIPRSRMVSIVDELESRGLLERAFAEAVAYEEQVGGSLTAAERQQLLDLLGQVSANLGIGAGAHAALREDEH